MLSRCGNFDTTDPLLNPKAAELWSLFNPAIHNAYYAAMRQMLETENHAGH